MDETIEIDGEIFLVADLAAAHKAQTEREKLQAAREARAKRYGIGIKEGDALTPPKGYPTDEADYGNPVGYKYSIDEEHLAAAISYFNRGGQREAGGYTSAEWAIVGGRITKRAGVEYYYEAGKVERKKEKKEADFGEKERLIRNAWYERFKKPAVPPLYESDLWVEKVYEDKVIVQTPQGIYSYSYTVTDDGIEFGEPVEVWIEYVPAIARSTRVAPIKSLGETDTAYIVGGYGLVWGSEDQRDLSPWKNDDGSRGEFFTPQTKGLDDIPVKVLTYEHDSEKGADDEPIRETLGTTILERNEKMGRWVEAQIEKAKTYARAIMQMIEEKRLYFSSETADHWRQSAKNGKITQWRTAGYTLTTHPMEPRFTGVSQLKAAYKSVGLELPQFTSGDDAGASCTERARLQALNQINLELLEFELGGLT